MDAPGVSAVPEPNGATTDCWNRSPVPRDGPPSAGGLRSDAPNVRPDPLIHPALGGTLRLPMRRTEWTQQRIVDVLIEERLFSGAFPRRSDWRHMSELHPCSETVVKAFGTWRAALAAADRQAPIENEISVPATVVEFVLASLPASAALRVLPIAFRYGYAPPDSELLLGRNSLERLLWTDLPRATDVKLAEKIEIVAALARFLRVVPDNPTAGLFAATCESPKTAAAIIGV